MNTVGGMAGGGVAGGGGFAGAAAGGGAGDGCAQACCDGTGAVTSTSWQYVGPGRGGYSQVSSYNYLGEGAGDWQRVVTTQFSGWQPKPCCLGLLCLMLLLPLVYVLLGKFTDGTDNSTGPDDQKTVPKIATLIVTPAPGPNCLDKSGWTPQKQSYCCEHFKIGCPRPQPPPPQPPQPPPPQPPQPPPPQPPRPQPPTPPVPPPPTSRPFDCSADWTTCHSCLLHRWSPAKRDYCCRTARRGCPMPGPAPPAPPAPPPPQPAPPISEPYDCQAGYTHCHHCLADKWSVSKINWCCAHHSMGCGAAR